jgi:hypothetical protein
MTQEFIEDARNVKWFATKGHKQHQEDDPSKALCHLNLFKHATAVDMTATAHDDKFVHAQLAAEKHAKEQSAASENQVAEEQAASEEGVVDASDESEPENDNLGKVHDQFCKAEHHPAMRKRKLRDVSNGKLAPDKIWLAKRRRRRRPLMHSWRQNFEHLMIKLQTRLGNSSSLRLDWPFAWCAMTSMSLGQLLQDTSVQRRTRTAKPHAHQLVDKFKHVFRMFVSAKARTRHKGKPSATMQPSTVLEC